MSIETQLKKEDIIRQITYFSRLLSNYQELIDLKLVQADNLELNLLRDTITNLNNELVDLLDLSQAPEAPFSAGNKEKLEIEETITVTLDRNFSNIHDSFIEEKLEEDFTQITSDI